MVVISNWWIHIKGLNEILSDPPYILKIVFNRHYVKSARNRSSFWSVFSRIRTECGEIRSISPYSVRMRDNTDQKNSEYGHFSRSASRHSLSWILKNACLLRARKLHILAPTLWSTGLKTEVYLHLQYLGSVSTSPCKIY